MKAVIVVHSVCGNDFLVGEAFAGALQAKGAAVRLLRVTDAAWVEKPDVPADARQVLQRMRALPEARPGDLVEADLIIMGSPTYFGNVSAQMKTFMDATGALWFQGALAGRHFAAFTSAGSSDGGGDHCLQALHTYARYMGLLPVPAPVKSVLGEHAPALGIIQYSDGKYAVLLDPKTSRVIGFFCEFLVRTVGK